MDDVARYNQARWSKLAAANALFTRPKLQLDEESAREAIDPNGEFGDLAGKNVLCLAGGGGQQSAAFGLLKANVTVVDLSAEQLERDRETAAHYGLSLTLHHADMRDLSMLPANHFDLVYQPYSLNFVPDAEVVFVQVARILKTAGLYQFMCANPLAAGMNAREWTGTGYPIRHFYVQGDRIEYADEDWVYDQDTHAKIEGPVEYRQTLDRLVGGLARQKFVLTKMQEVVADNVDPNATPGEWDHFTAMVPPWLILRAVYRPDVLP